MTSFLSDAKARIQHTNKLSLAPKDIKNLAEIISTEKSVLSTSSKLSVDYRKAAEALKEWGLNEGDDLADILPKMSILLCHLADAQSRFSDHDGTYRIHFKSIRMREESLATLKKSKETIQAKIIGLEKKITKMSSENKDLPGLTTRLQESRSELISLENSVAIEEARLSDFKRETVREGLNLRLGAMLELAEKMTIVCEFGKMLTSEVPIERTAPGGTRSPYCASNKTQAVVEEAQRCLTEVVFNPTHSTPNLNNEHSSELPPSQSPSIDTEHPSAPHSAPNHTDSSHSLPMELPPLYFNEPAPPEDPTQSSQAPHLSNDPYGSNPGQVTHLPLDNYSSLPYTQESGASPHPNPNPHLPYHTTSATSPPMPASQTPASLASRLTPRSPPETISGESPSYVDNVFYVRDLNGVPRSTGPGNPAELLDSPSSIYSPPSSANPPSEGQPLRTSRLSQPSMQSSPLQYATNLNSPGGPSKPLSAGPGRSEADETVTKSRYAPRSRDQSISAGVSGVPTSEGRRTNAGAFRRPAGNNQISSPPGSQQTQALGSTQAIIATDEALSTANSTLVQPLQINKRDTASSTDLRDP
ncbi:hypothetical protein MJO28_008285 [Puccinia striiformis f. sp. tritici]|uniref:Uncharacterized protein n=1 Tax=Puccinia striiformis f. sp. tritici TaxID=168172 RepID=A0ACC0EAH7_9BASI|nr:hypothetical protein Pst134EA_015638 [Puccinia striiformis f. sp. tritici]KAH9463548.1 hypothetical protein Pst134EA_015638 [Puccinia striiformis f. sp. tritici]KAI7949464.1 hypothetical protein MJO28_008285 [Puccinia striiformis f. sp. tritici]